MIEFRIFCVSVITYPPFSKISELIESEIDNVKKFPKISTGNIERDFKRNYLVRTCSVATNRMKSLDFYADLCYHDVPFLDNYRTVLYSLIFTPIEALQ